ncbi:MAG: Rrf2 family transcriptional regulator [Spirochaetia bacterium]|nr:Rrf2 family transcriptional regulator [Spirochaetia bacterium]
MIISAKLNYSIKAVLELARSYGSGRLLNLETISESQNIPQPFLLQIMSLLKRGGIVESIRGVSGGYMLTKGAGEIKIKDVIMAVEPSLLMGKKESDNSVEAAIENIWNTARSRAESYFEEISFEILLDKTITKENLSYNI